jgi:hypothetical protein
MKSLSDDKTEQMKREHLIKASPIAMIALVILARNLREGGHDYWSYACYAVILVLAVYTIASRSAVPGDATTRNRKRLMLGLALLTVIILFIIQYLRIV